MIELSKAEWSRLYKELQVIANRMTFTRSRAREWTARDRAQEAVQRACLRYLEIRPAWLDSLDAVRSYLVGAVRSELGHEVRLGVTRVKKEGTAATEEALVTTGATPSAETRNLEARQRVTDITRSARLVRALRRKLEANNDKLALDTMKLIAQGKASPTEQQKILGCSLEDIYNARKRRKRAMDELLAEEKSEDGGQEKK